MQLGYNTNGFGDHEPIAALEVLAEIGFRGVAITIDHRWANPYADDFGQQLTRLSSALRRLNLASVIETGARFLLDARRKHHPTLVSPEAADRRRRVQFLERCVDIAAELRSSCVSLWSGVVAPDISREVAWQWLIDGLGPLIDYAARQDVALAFEPEPGMLVDTTARWMELARVLPALKLTLDIGHLHCLREWPLETAIRRARGAVVNVHIEDMRAGVHEHLMFGAGEIDFPPVIAALAEIGYRGPLNVELSRHSHDAVTAARRSFAFLSELMNPA
jgi:sugar phosphate isomerase/epimerase